MAKLAGGIVEIKTPDGMLPCAGKFTYQLSGIVREPVVNQNDGTVDYIEKYTEGMIEGEVLLKAGVNPDSIRATVDTEITLSLGNGPSGPVAVLTLYEAFHGPATEGDSDAGTLKVKFFGRTEMLVNG